MLEITIKATELFNDETQKFINLSEDVTLTLEHSLVSLSKWEQKWEKPFLGRDERTAPETIDYIKCMTLTPDISPMVYNALDNEVLNQVGEYINAKMTATWFNDIPGHARTNSSETITAEIIYYWLVALEIPFEVQEWHLNRLLTLVRVINIKNDPKKKMMPRREAADQQRMLNEERKVRFGTKG